MDEKVELLPLGSRVECGMSWVGTLMNYFVGENKKGVSTLYGVIRLDKTFRERNSDGSSGAYLDMLVVHSANLHPEGHYAEYA